MVKKDKSSLNIIWNFFTSVRLTVVVLLSLALTSVIGTLIPQNESPHAYIKAYGEVFFKLFKALDIFDMYHSWWFQLLLATLTVNIIVCSIDRLSSLWKTIFVKEPSFRIKRFRKLGQKEIFTDKRPIARLKEIYEPVIRRSFAYLRAEDTDKGIAIFAEKGRWTRLGVYIVHFSVICLLIGGLIGSIFGFEGFMNIPEGEWDDTIIIRNSDKHLKLNFRIKCNDFNVSFYESGAPREYRSSLEIIENGKTVLKKDIIVNDPLHYKGINIYQASYGTIPMNSVAALKSGINLSFTSNITSMTYTKKAFPDKPVELPENGGTFTIKGLIHSYMFMGQRDLGETLVGILKTPDGNETEVKLPLRFPKFDMMRRGKKFVISIAGYTEKYYTGLQIAKDPGVPVVYLGFIMMIIGCFVTFFMSHQRICVELMENKNKTRVVVSGIANKDKVGMEDKIKRIAKRLKSQK